MDALEYFSGGVPPLAYFRIRVDEILSLSMRDKSNIYSFTTELCMIGLASYFEAYCKDQFAAVINICPQLLKSLSDDREFKISAKSVVHFAEEFPYKLGFMLAEDRDFGSAKAINALFHDLLKITPFSKPEMNRYSEFLNDRNLLVHHGGVFTMKYLSQKRDVGVDIGGSHMLSLVVTHGDLVDWTDFLMDIARKTASASQAAVLKFMQRNDVVPDAEMKMAIDYLTSPQ
jgi:hypothetical protein